jgi:hypothetical protein
VRVCLLSSFCWQGPYRILEKVGLQNYKIARVEGPKAGRALKQLVHVQRLKPFEVSSDIPPASDVSLRADDSFDPELEDDHDLFYQSDPPAPAAVAVPPPPAPRAPVISNPESAPVSLSVPVSVSVSGSVPSRPPQDDSKQLHPVDRIIRRRKGKKGREEFLVKWIGDFSPSWEPARNLTSDLRSEFHRYIAVAKQAAREAKRRSEPPSPPPAPAVPPAEPQIPLRRSTRNK